MKIEKFVFGKDKTPVWFDKECQIGRVKTNYDEDGKPISIRINSGLKIYDAIIGDTIIKSATGLVVVHQNQVEKSKKQK